MCIDVMSGWMNGSKNKSTVELGKKVKSKKYNDVENNGIDGIWNSNKINE